MLLNTLYCFAILACIVYIESQTFTIERIIAFLFREKDIPVEVMPEFVSLSPSTDTEEIETKLKMDEEIKFMQDYIYSNIHQGDIGEVTLDDDDYVPLTPSEVSM